MISPEIEGVDSGTWKALRKPREKAASWGGSKARMRSCRVAMVAGSRAASLAGPVVPIEAWPAVGWGLAMAAGIVECLVPLLPCPWFRGGPLKAAAIGLGWAGVRRDGAA